MIRFNYISLFILMILFFGCNNSNGDNKTFESDSNLEDIPLLGRPYFEFDEVEHYTFEITNAEIESFMSKKHLTSKEKDQYNLLLNYYPYKYIDTLLYLNIERVGFIKHKLSLEKNEEMCMLFSKKSHKDIIMFSCGPVFRDILIFKKMNRIIGVAKICFTCNQSLIIGTLLNTEDFGQSGDYARLHKILYGK